MANHIKLSQHTEWLSLIEVSGPFLALPVLEKTFPQGLDIIEVPRRQRLRSAYEEWCDAVESEDPLLSDLHREWIRLVFSEFLEYDDSTLKMEKEITTEYTIDSPEHTESFKPDWLVLSSSDGKPKFFISIQTPGTDFEKVRKDDRWPASLLERMTALCRVNGVRLGLITDGERWMLVNAPSGSTSSCASWYARLWFQEPITLKAFQSLFGVRRCFGPTEETLESLLESSLKHHEEITDTLGEQVRRAVEVLVQCLDKADADRNRELLRGITPAELYEAGLTVMMRLVFILCAEERGLLLLGNPIYDEFYAVSTLRSQLAEEADKHGPEILDRRHDAWARLLSVFRAVHGGIDHESLRMPALGGSLFDPDKFPFLEGRSKGTTWKDSGAIPLPIDNRTVLLLLSSLQLLEQHTGALLLSYRALDVEQIGHVYEGLLEHTVVRVPSVTVGLVGSQNAKNPNLPLSEMESALLDSEEAFVSLVMETTKRSESTIRKALAHPLDDASFGRLLSVCGGDTSLTERIRPFANLLRTDAWEDPIVYREDAFMITMGADRRETGTHYTPKSLTESIVETTLEPVVYIGPSEGTPRDEWCLKNPAELLALKICDPAMGSGAFLVQTCRWLSERLVEAWASVEAEGKCITSDGEVRQTSDGTDPMPTALDERLITARRLIAERCLYGVDVNPLAVELAKLSIWLITMAEGRPFGFLDHNLRHGDSLLGIYLLDQLTKLNLHPHDGPYQLCIFSQNVAEIVSEVIEIRKRIRAIQIRDIRDVEAMAHLDGEARKKLEAVELVADAMIGEVLQAKGNSRVIDSALNSLAMQAGAFLDGDEKMGASIAKEACSSLSVDLPKGKPPRRPFHWPLEYPEVFQRENGGFNVMIGNPPFLGGRRIRRSIGEAYLSWLTTSLFRNASGNADLCAFFFRRVNQLLCRDGYYGSLATNTISQGDTRDVGLFSICEQGSTIYHAISNLKWPGTANLTVALVWITKSEWSGVCKLDGQIVKRIGTSLTNESFNADKPKILKCNSGRSFQGSIVLGSGFVLTPESAKHLLSKDKNNSHVIFPYLRGEDFLSEPNQSPTTFVINFFDWPLDRENAPKDYSGPVASDYPDCLSIVEELVKPERTRRKANGQFALRKPLPQKWWIYSDKRPALYKRIAGLRRVLFHSFTGKYVIFDFVPAGYVYAGPHNVFATDADEDFAILQSSFHNIWAWEHCSTMETRLRYANRNLFETFPFPSAYKKLKEIGAVYHSHRKDMLKSHGIGLTNLYNKFHDSSIKDKDCVNLRDIHATLDNEVSHVYGWHDIDLQHGFHQTKQGIRFTVS